MCFDMIKTRCRSGMHPPLHSLERQDCCSTLERRRGLHDHARPCVDGRIRQAQRQLGGRQGRH